jgi:hypothetical protein
VNYKRAENPCANERCETKGPENVTLSTAYEHHYEPEGCESQPEVKRKNFFPRMADQKKPVPFSENRPPSDPPRQHNQRHPEGN